MGYIAEAAKVVKIAIENLAVNATDEIAAKSAVIYPYWSSETEYHVGERYNYNGVLYKCLTAHTSQDTWTPDVSPSLWAKVLIPDQGIIPEWEQPESTNGYSTGDKVTHNGKTWESLVDNNVWEPGVAGTESLWKEVT